MAVSSASFQESSPCPDSTGVSHSKAFQLIKKDLIHYIPKLNHPNPLNPTEALHWPHCQNSDTAETNGRNPMTLHLDNFNIVGFFPTNPLASGEKIQQRTCEIQFPKTVFNCWVVLFRPFYMKNIFKCLFLFHNATFHGSGLLPVPVFGPSVLSSVPLSLQALTTSSQICAAS